MSIEQPPQLVAQPSPEKRELDGGSLKEILAVLNTAGVDYEVRERIKALYEAGRGEIVENMTMRSLGTEYKTIEERATNEWREISELIYLPAMAETWAEYAEKLREACPNLDVKIDTDNFTHSPLKVRKIK